jgi:diacylglycerol kinase (ATP)
MSEIEPDSRLPPKKKGMARLIAATGFSLAGLKAALQHGEAFRLEVVIFCILAPAGLWLGQSRVEQVLLVGSLFIVLLMELINSAVDIGSAAVFVALVLVVFTWGMLLL